MAHVNGGDFFMFNKIFVKVVTQDKSYKSSVKTKRECWEWQLMVPIKKYVNNFTTQK